jgi:hypothetical protein
LPHTIETATNASLFNTKIKMEGCNSKCNRVDVEGSNKIEGHIITKHIEFN